MPTFSTASRLTGLAYANPSAIAQSLANSANGLTGWRYIGANDNTGPGKSGEYEAIFVNDSAKQVFISSRGTQGLAGLLGSDGPADATIMLGGVPQARVNDAINEFNSLSAAYPGYAISGGGHSLGGEVMAQTSEQLLQFDKSAFPVLVEDSPSTGTVTQFDANVWAITAQGDLVGHTGAGYSNTIEFNDHPGLLGWLNQWGAGGTHDWGKLTSWIAQQPTLGPAQLGSPLANSLGQIDTPDVTSISLKYNPTVGEVTTVTSIAQGANGTETDNLVSSATGMPSLLTQVNWTPNGGVNNISTQQTVADGVGGTVSVALTDSNADGIWDSATISGENVNNLIVKLEDYLPGGNGQASLSVGALYTPAAGTYGAAGPPPLADIPGFVLGSQIGELLGGNNVFAKLASGTVIGALGAALSQNVGTDWSQALSANGDSVAKSFGDNLGGSFATVGVSLVSSQLTNELLHALGITGFGGQLASFVITPGVNAAITFEVNQLFPGLKLQPGGGLSPTNIASFFGQQLGQFVLAPQTQAAVVLADLGSTVGSSIGANIGTYLAGPIGGVIGSFVGSFIGDVIGTLVGDLFGHKKPRIPTATAAVVLQIPIANYAVGSTSATNGGDLNFVVQMANAAATALNGIMYQVVGASGLVANAVSPTQTYGLNGATLYVNYGGTEYDESTGNLAVDKGVIWAIKQTQLIGGNIFAKRAIAHSTASDVTSLMADLQIAADYTKYRESWQSMNQLMAANPNSALTAGWIVTLQRVNELNLDAWGPSDYYGGMRGLIDSFNLPASGLNYENVSFGWSNGMQISVPSAMGQGVFSIMPTASADGSSMVVDNYGSGGLGLNIGSIVAGANNYVNYAGQPQQMNLTTLSGNNVLVGTDGSDTYRLGSGTDWLITGNGVDTVAGGTGNDVIITGWNNDTVYAGTGATYIYAGGGNDIVYGGAGADTMVVGGLGGHDQFFGGSGADTFEANPNATWAWIVGGTGSNTLAFDRFTTGVNVNLSVLAGWAWAPTASSVYGMGVQNVQNITGSPFNDVLETGASGGTLEGLGGADQLIGGGGVTTASYQHSAAGVNVDLSTNVAFGGDATGDTFTNVKNLIGSNFNDQLKGLPGSILNGGAGDDTLLYSGSGTQYVGGDGFDTVDYSAGPVSTVYNGVDYGTYVNLAGNTGNWDATGDTWSSIEKVIGTAYDDDIFASASGTTMDGGGGNDYLVGGPSSDTYVFNNNYGVDTISDSNAAANVVSFGAGLSFDNLWIATAGGSSGYLEIGIRGESGYVKVTGNFATLGNNVIKTLDMNGASQVDISQTTFALGGSDNAETLYGMSNQFNMIFAYGGNDTIYAQNNQVTYNGAVIDGGTGNDTIYASNGDDQYLFDRGDGQDTITDTGGQNSIIFGPTVAASDVIYQVYGNDLYIGVRDLNNPNTTAMNVSDNMRFIGGGVLYENNDGTTYQNTVDYVIASGTSVNLSSLNLPWTIKQTGHGGGGGTQPIVLDISGAGLQLSPVASSDIVASTANGIITRMGWVGPGNGILAVDRSGDGKINTTSDISFVHDKAGATTDLQGLAGWDTNGDGILDAKDTNWGKLLIWVDQNQNGIADPGEVQTLAQAGITSINLKPTPTGFNGRDTIDSYVQNTTTFTRSDGTTGTAYDVTLAQRFLTASGIENAPDVTWDQITGNQTIGHLLNDPMAAATAAAPASGTAAPASGTSSATAALTTVGQAIGTAQITEAQLSKLANVDFKGGGTISATDATRWADFLDPTKNAVLKAALAAGMSGADLLTLIKTTTAFPAGTDQLTGRGVQQPLARAADPLVVDFSGKGLTLIDPSASKVKIDAQRTGVPEQVGWVGGGGGILAYDLNGDGKVDPISEISLATEKPGAKTSIDGLAAFDINGDGVINAQDSSYGNFLIWRDANRNGVSDPGETETLAQAGVTSISLKASNTVPSNSVVSSNQILGQITVTLADGTTRTAYDTSLGVYDPNAASASGSSGAPVTQQAVAEMAAKPVNAASSSPSSVNANATLASTLQLLGRSLTSVAAARLGQDGPEGTPSQAGAETATDTVASAWWRGRSSSSPSVLDSVGAMTLAGASTGVAPRRSGPIASSQDAATAQRQLLLRQSLATFHGDMGGGAAMWTRQGDTQSAQLAVAARSGLAKLQPLSLTA